MHFTAVDKYLDIFVVLTIRYSVYLPQHYQSYLDIFFSYLNWCHFTNGYIFFQLLLFGYESGKINKIAVMDHPIINTIYQLIYI